MNKILKKIQMNISKLSMFFISAIPIKPETISDGAGLPTFAQFQFGYMYPWKNK